ncbi:hypothetical protein ACSW8N_03695 [Clostridium perfringens]|uniref:Uncharacterized protein n=1 Tax=Clostridium perfringens E str. JGS1987 TaxID=451755 RepID=B1BVS7_CLOPF|nr:hypothetical protein [Clostridium perfringens]EDT14197.1 hypothetical protein AC3_A0662 [Clostridium perfringens E str. JGS1987]
MFFDSRNVKYVSEKIYAGESIYNINNYIYSKSYLRKEKIGVIIILACVIAIV